jgi:hypothetical protein
MVYAFGLKYLTLILSLTNMFVFKIIVITIYFADQN